MTFELLILLGMKQCVKYNLFKQNTASFNENNNYVDSTYLTYIPVHLLSMSPYIVECLANLIELLLKAMVLDFRYACGI